MGNYIEYSVLTKFCGGQNLRGVVKGHFTKRLRGQWGLGTNLAGEGGGVVVWGQQPPSSLLTRVNFSMNLYKTLVSRESKSSFVAS